MATATSAEHAVTPRFTCLECGAFLEHSAGRLDCEQCAASYPESHGVGVFCSSEAFYEDYLEEHCPFVRNPPTWKAALLRVLPYWSWREWKFFRRHLKPGLAVLDLGCARGKEWFITEGGFVAGADPTPEPLRECAEHYDLVAQAEITRLPFPDEAFDVVVTSHVIGHISFDEKDAALAEIARVLRPGGLSLNIIETDSRNRFVELGKSDPELYQRNFIETDGHIGLELPSAVLARFRRHGFSIGQVEKMESGIVHARYYGKYLENGYSQRHRLVRRQLARWQRIQRNAALLGLYEVAMGSYHTFVAQRRTPLDNAMFIMLAARKNGAAGGV